MSGQMIGWIILRASSAFRHTWLYPISALPWVTLQNHSSSPATSELSLHNSFAAFGIPKNVFLFKAPVPLMIMKLKQKYKKQLKQS